MNGIHAFTQYVRERLRSAGYPAFIAGSEDLRNEPPPNQMHGVWVMHPIASKYQAFDLTEDKTRMTFALIGLWSGVGTEVTAKCIAGKKRAMRAILDGARPAEVLEVTIPYEEQPVSTLDGRTEIAFRIHTTLLEV